MAIIFRQRRKQQQQQQQTGCHTPRVLILPSPSFSLGPLCNLRACRLRSSASSSTSSREQVFTCTCSYCFLNILPCNISCTTYAPVWGHRSGGDSPGASTPIPPRATNDTYPASEAGDYDDGQSEVSALSSVMGPASSVFSHLQPSAAGGLAAAQQHYPGERQVWRCVGGSRGGLWPVARLSRAGPSFRAAC